MEMRVAKSFMPIFLPSIEKKRFIVMYGGRGGAKSYSIAKKLILCALKEKDIKILCCREFQSSIKDSVHALLSEVIEKENLSSYFEILKAEIRCKNKSTFIFKGIAKNIAEIKSLQGVKYCWVEEAENVSSFSWEVLIPTIRLEGSQFYISFNPKEETNATYQRFISKGGDDVLKIFCNYTDNPYLSETIKKQIERDKELMPPEMFENIWLGKPLKISDAVIFKGCYEVVDFETKQDAKFMFGADWGFENDPNVILRCYIDDAYLYIDYAIFDKDYFIKENGEYELRGKPTQINEMSLFIEKMPDIRNLNKFSKIYADSARPEIISYLRQHNFNILGVKKQQSYLRPEDRAGKVGYVEAGISAIKGKFKKVIIHPRNKNLIIEMQKYEFKKIANTAEITNEPIDKYNHGIDALRYALSDIIFPAPKLFIGSI